MNNKMLDNSLKATDFNKSQYFRHITNMVTIVSYISLFSLCGTTFCHYVNFRTDSALAFASSYWRRWAGIRSYVSRSVWMSSSISTDFSKDVTATLDDTAGTPTPWWPLVIVFTNAVLSLAISEVGPFCTKLSSKVDLILTIPLLAALLPLKLLISLCSSGTCLLKVTYQN